MTAVLPNSVLLEDWINPHHLLNSESWLKLEPFEHCIVPQFFREEIFIALRQNCDQLNQEMFSDHPTNGYRFAAFPCVEFFRFIYSPLFRQFLKNKLSFNLTSCKAFSCPQIYHFNTEEPN